MSILYFFQISSSKLRYSNYKIVVEIQYFSQNQTSNIYLSKVSNRDTRRRCEVCLKLTMKTPERLSGVFVVNFEHISFLGCDSNRLEKD